MGGVWRRMVMIAVASSITGCSERPSPPGRVDAGSAPRDGAVTPDGGPTGGRRDGGAVLPPVDHELELPYGTPPRTITIALESQVGRLDVFFSIDTTGSFGGEIDNLQSQLRSEIVPGLRADVEDVFFGVGGFEDFPTSPWGAPTDRPFRLLSGLTDNLAQVDSAVARLDSPLGMGGDAPESGAEALYQIATGEGYPSLVPARPLGFREDSLRAIVHVTDAPSHTPEDYLPTYPNAHSLDEAITALQRERITVLGIASGEAARGYLEQTALATGASTDPDEGFCPTGVDGTARAAVDERCPLVFDVRADGSGLSGVALTAISDLLETLRWTEVWGEADDPLRFVRAIAVGEDPEGSVDDRRPIDGIDDTYVDVRPGQPLRFEFQLANFTVQPADYEQYFRVELRVVGDGRVLESRQLRVVVPRGRLERDAGVPRDAGTELLDATAIDGGPLEDAGLEDAGLEDAGPPAPDAS